MHKDFPEFFNGAFLKPDTVSYRHYQHNIVQKCKNKNSLVVLPTGLGKTVIGILLMTNALERYSEGKILILAPTRPLVSQHKDSCEKFIDIDEDIIVSFTGMISPERRIFLFNESKIIVSTPQVIKNDIMNGRYDLNHVSLIIFDEAHRTKGNYAYNFISQEYINTCSDPLVLGLTASPGKNYEYIQELCNNLFVENIVFKNYDDNDVVDYIHEIDTFLERVELPIRIHELSEVWYTLFKTYLRFFIERDLINPYKKYYSKLDFLGIAQDLSLSLNYENNPEIFPDEELYLEQLYFHDPKIIDVVRGNKLNIQSIFSYCSSCVSLLHAKDLLETQEIKLFKTFLSKIQYKADQDILSAKRIVNSKHFNYINTVLKNADTSKLRHPKIYKLISLINEEIEEFNNRKIIIFTQYREMAQFLKEIISEKFEEQLKVEKFIGQATKFDDFGFSQNKQIEILKDFRDDKVNILIATSVAEEGLDIPNVDAIIFYEPVPSEIRLIQRRGRTGRFAPGRCYILVAEDTTDIPFYYVACRKESTMNSVLSCPEQLELNTDLERKRIQFSQPSNNYSEFEVIKNFKERREREKELLANRSIEAILTELDNFASTKEYEELKNYGVSFMSDIVDLDKLKLKKNVLKLKGKKNTNIKERKRYINGNVKTLINIVKTFNENGKLAFSEFQDLAEDEDITDKKFYAHLNQACYLGYLKRGSDCVQFIKDYD